MQITNKLLRFFILLTMVGSTTQLWGSETIDKAFVKIKKSLREVPCESFIFESGGKHLHLVCVGDQKLSAIIFIHGSPGSWDAYVSYLTNKDLLSSHYLVSVDRPGFGLSDKGYAEPSLHSQAKQIAAALSFVGIQHGATLVGHSYGGPIVVRMLIDYPKLSLGAVIIAGSVSPELEVVHWYQRVAMKSWISWALPNELDVANREIFPLKGELEKMRPELKTIRTPITIIHGTKDALVPYDNASFLVEQLASSQVKLITLTNVNHFIPWTHTAVVLKALTNK